MNEYTIDQVFAWKPTENIWDLVVYWDYIRYTFQNLNAFIKIYM